MNTQLRVHPEVRSTPGDEDGSVLINLQSGKVFSLNGTGARIWTMLEKGVDFDGVLDTLSREHQDIPRRNLQTDLEVFVHELERKNLLRIAA